MTLAMNFLKGFAFGVFAAALFLFTATTAAGLVHFFDPNLSRTDSAGVGLFIAVVAAVFGLANVIKFDRHY